MMVDLLYVVGIKESESDTENCVDALISKYETKCKEVRKVIYTFNESKANPTTVVKSIAAAEGKLSSSNGKAEGEAKIQSSVSPDTVGMYLVGNFHTASQAIEYHSGEAVAEIVSKITSKLDYINLVACNAAKEPSPAVRGRQGIFMDSFCSALANGSPSLTPVIAAYMGFVDVAHSGQNHAAFTSKGDTSVKDPAFRGKKLIGVTANNAVLRVKGSKEGMTDQELGYQNDIATKKTFWQSISGTTTRLEGRLNWRADISAPESK